MILLSCHKEPARASPVRFATQPNFKRLPVHFAVAKGSDQGGDGSVQHNSPLGSKTRRLASVLLAVHVFASLTVMIPQAARAETTNGTAALREMTRGSWVAARSLVQQSRDPTLVTMYEWMLYRENFTGLPFDRIAAFIRKHPQWPDLDEVIATAERNMPAGYPATDVMSWYQAYPPVTGVGLKRLSRYAHGCRTAGNCQSGLAGSLARVGEQARCSAPILKTYGAYINADTRRKRLDYLLFHEDDTTARSYAALLGADYLKLAEARIALSNGRKNAASLVDRVPALLARDPGLAVRTFALAA